MKINLERGVEEKEIHLARCREQARINFARNEHHADHGVGRMEARKPISFKSADVPKPDTVAFNCQYTIWCNQKTKLQNYYREAT